eukprot:TRINITY_DN1669_c0_g1_i1.p1 TRINITY_DN1669_c0_g1~~TRINITY_DN1669_c0_g1_i1.p1  ORF type:complete len:483 (+),score=36.96 TRINITY_DN1669_c0_g1_i1:252-1700(+)
MGAFTEGREGTLTVPATQEMTKQTRSVASRELVAYSNGKEAVSSPVTEFVPVQRVVVNHNIDNSSGSCYRHDCLSLLLFCFHAALAGAAVGYLGYLGVRRALNGRFQIAEWYPKLAAAAGIGAVFPCVWQALIRWKPNAMVKGILYSSPIMTFAASVMLVSASIPANVGLGVVLLLLAIGLALYACYVTPRVEYAAVVLTKSLEPATKMIPDVHHPCYWVTLVALLWTLLWSLGIAGAISNEYSALIILGLLLSYAWTMEVLRNVVNITVSRVVALFYVRGMQSDVKFAFGRALNKYIGTVILGSLMIPLCEFLRALARVLSFVEEEDEFMFSCAHCCLRVVEFLLRFGNSWAFVQAGTYGKGYVEASRDTWRIFQGIDMEPVVDRDITSALCFLSGIAGGSLCVLACGSWTLVTRKHFTATVSVLSFIIGYFMSRIGVAVPQACVCAYYVCYAENPQNRHFDNTIAERIKYFQAVTAMSSA